MDRAVDNENARLVPSRHRRDARHVDVLALDSGELVVGAVDARPDLFLRQWAHPAAIEPEDVDPAAKAEEIQAVLEEIAGKDRLFDAKSFLGDAGSAFEMILGAFASGDKDTLSSFVSKDVYAGFAEAIDARAAEGQHLELTLLKAPETRYYRAEVSGNMAFVTLTINSEQIQVTRDKAGEVVSGDPAQTSRVEDHWNFSRKLGSSDPIWTLIATRA